MKKVFVAAACLGMVLLILVGYGWWKYLQDRELIVPMGVSYHFDSFRVDQELSDIQGQFSRHEHSFQSNGCSRITSEHSSVHAKRQKTHDRDNDTHAAINANFSLASVLSGNFAAIDPSVDLGAGLTDKWNDHAESGNDYQKNVDVVTKDINDKGNEYASGMSGKLGAYYLRFTLSLKNLDANDAYVVKAENAPVKVWVRGPDFNPPLNFSVDIPDLNGKRLSYDELLIQVNHRIPDVNLLDQLLICQREGTLNTRLVAEIHAQDFPLISEKSKKNVFQQMKEWERTVPTSEIAIDFGDASRFSPWKVRRWAAREFIWFGDRKRVTLHDALRAINRKISQDGSVEYGTFEISKHGLHKVCGRDVGRINESDGTMILVERDGLKEMSELDISDLSRSVVSFEHLRFMQRKVVDEVDAFVKGGGDREAIEKLIRVLENCDGAKPQLARMLVHSDLNDDVKKGLGILSDLMRQDNKLAMEEVIRLYVRIGTEYEIKDLLHDALSRLRAKDRRWAAGNMELARQCAGRLIADGDANAFISLMKLGYPQSSADGSSMLMGLVKSGNMEFVGQYIKSFRPDVNAVSANGVSALLLAVERCDLGMCKLLFEHGAKMKSDDDSKCITPIDLASTKTNGVEIIDYLIRQGANIGDAPFVAIMCDNLAALKFFVEKCNIDVNGIDRTYGTLLTFAVAKGSDVVCKYLIENGADVNLEVAEGVTPFTLAWDKQDIDKIKMCMEKTSFASNDELVAFMMQDKYHVLAEYFMRKEKVGDFKNDEFGKKCLAVALKNDAPLVLKVCLENNGMTVNSFLDGDELIYSAVRHGAVKVVDYLARQGGNVNFHRDGIMTPIEFAAKIGKVDVVKKLLEGCSAVIGDAIYKAVEFRQNEVLSYFWSVKQNGNWVAPIDYDTGKGTLLGYAVSLGDIEMCRWLISCGFKVNHQDKHGWTPLDRAILNDQEDVLRYLIEQEHAQFEDAPIVAAENGKLWAVKYFCEKQRVHPYYQYGDRGFMLAGAAARGQLDVCKYLVGRGALLDKCVPVQNKSGKWFRSAMERAIANCGEDVVNKLKDLRGDNVINPPISIAFRSSLFDGILGSSYVLKIINRADDDVGNVSVRRAGELIYVYDNLIRGNSFEIGWNELGEGKGFGIGDTGYIEVSYYSRKLYYEFTKEGRLSWRYDD